MVLHDLRSSLASDCRVSVMAIQFFALRSDYGQCTLFLRKDKLFTVRRRFTANSSKPKHFVNLLEYLLKGLHVAFHQLQAVGRLHRPEHGKIIHKPHSHGKVLFSVLYLPGIRTTPRAGFAISPTKLKQIGGKDGLPRPLADIHPLCSQGLLNFLVEKSRRRVSSQTLRTETDNGEIVDMRSVFGQKRWNNIFDFGKFSGKTFAVSLS